MSDQTGFHSQMKIVIKLKFNFLSLLVAGRFHMLTALKSTTFPNYCIYVGLTAFPRVVGTCRSQL